MNNTKFYYSFNLANNEFQGKYPALKNPRRQSEFLLPARATFESPPETKENEIAIWIGSKWQIETDLRGQLQVNISTKEVTTISDIGEIKSGFQQIDELTAEKIRQTPDAFEVKNAILVDISDMQEYIERQQAKEKNAKKIELERQIEDLDKKRIRAICEPEIRNESTGETWLDYYNERIYEIREEINGLK